MLRITPQTSSADAKKYYSRADYYDLEMAGQWLGKGAATLGLQGQVSEAAFNSLCDNLHPQTGEQLTARTIAERRVLFDFTFDCPKSVSLEWQLGGDPRIFDAFRDSVRETMADIEKEIAVRVRKGGRQDDRISGNLVGAEFYHTTTRPSREDGNPDPFLHCHFTVFNAVFDPTEEIWKAAEIGRIKSEANFWGAVAYAKLANKLEDLGYATRRTKHGFELAGIDDKLVRKFSRRTEEIEKLAKQLGITDQERKAKLGATSRLAKSKNLSADDLRDYWRSRLSTDDASALQRVRLQAKVPSLPPADRSAEAVNYAKDHCFARDSVVSERQFQTEALRHGVGAVDLQTVQAVMQRHQDLLWGQRAGRSMVTTKHVLDEERKIVGFARKGRGTCKPLGKPGWFIHDDKLNAGQQNAVRRVLESASQICIVRGKAGTGKTRLLRELVGRIEENGKHVFAFAPTAEASRGVLREEAKIANADTVARLLVDVELQREVAGQVVVIDEASLISAPNMVQVFDLAGELGFRVVLFGDKRQHGSVERGSALKLLEDEAGLPVAEVSEIMRQKRAEYIAAVQDLSEGHTEAGFDKLDRLGWVQEIADVDQRQRQIAADYVQAVQQGKSCLVVAPAKIEGEKVTAAIREELKAVGRLGGKEREFLRLDSTDWTEAERGDAVNYDGGEVLVFQKPAKGFQKGQRVQVDNPATAPLDKAARFQAYRPGSLRIVAGDVLRITKNGFTRDKKRLNNGMLVQVKGFTRQGDIELKNGWVIDKYYGFIAPGYVLTSFASQGKSPDRVLIAQSADSFPASSREQFYVSCSRGKESCTVYTSDRDELRKAIHWSDPKLTATELVNDGKRRRDVEQHQQKQSRRQRLLKHVAFIQRLANLGRNFVQRQMEKIHDYVPQKVMVHER